MSSKITYENDKITCEVSKELSLLEALQNEQTQLLKKLAKISQGDNDNYGTYKNIIQALSEVTRLIEKESWKDMYSHYQLKDGDGEFQEVVSTWRQKGEDIKDHHIYSISGEIIRNKKVGKFYGGFEFCENVEDEEIFLDIPKDFQNENTEVSVSLRSIEGEGCSCSIYGKITDDYKLKLSLSCNRTNSDKSKTKIRYSYVLISNN